MVRMRILSPTSVLYLATSAVALNIHSYGAYKALGLNSRTNIVTMSALVPTHLHGASDIQYPTGMLTSTYTASTPTLKSTFMSSRPAVNSASLKPSQTKNSTSAAPGPTGTSNSTCTSPYWLESIKHQGIAAFNTNPASYQIFRNVKDYGAKGDGVTDDTAAINRAIRDGNRCAPGQCESSTTTPAIVYFPLGTYVISDSIIDYYYTQMIGNPNCMPTILASSNFNSKNLALIDASPYQQSGPRVGQTGYGATNTFFRQIRNIIIDMTRLPPTLNAPAGIAGIHWPTGQATSLQNIVFNMNTANGTLHTGLFIEEGSGGFMTDLVFNGGNKGFSVGNQQFTTRNLTFNNVNTAIDQLWDWGWTYQNVKINNCRVGFNLTATANGSLNIGSVTLIDSEINDTPIAIVTNRTNSSRPESAGNLYLENVKLNNVATTVMGPSGAYLTGSSGPSIVSAWADGHRYLPNGPVKQRGPVNPSNRPSDLLDSRGNYYGRSKPQYATLSLSQFLSARDLGARGDGKTDDTRALNNAIIKAQSEGKVLFLDAGFYMVTDTIYVPPGSKLVGEALASVILSSGAGFNDINAPKVVVKIAQPGEQGRIEMSDLIVSTRGQQMGAILIESNIATYDAEPSGLWDVHTRIGGFAGSNLQVAQCVKTPNVTITPSNLERKCIAAYMSMHITKFGTGLYLENDWMWTADHDLDDALNNNTQLTIYAGRGLYVESQRGRLWLYGTSVEHHVKYQYQFADTRNVVMGQIQTETAYYQPNPDATVPFPENSALNDPIFTPSSNSSIHAANGWGLRILRSNNIFGYGVDLYSFFINNSDACAQPSATEKCQTRILSIEGQGNSYNIDLYNINTVGTTAMITQDGVDIAFNDDNKSTFVDSINIFRTR